MLPKGGGVNERLCEMVGGVNGVPTVQARPAAMGLGSKRGRPGASGQMSRCCLGVGLGC